MRIVKRPALSPLVAGVALAILGLSSHVEGQDAVRIEEIRADLESHLSEIRSIEGVVDRLVSRDGEAPPAFYVEDDFGHQLLVLPLEETPARGDRVRATGVVSLDPAGDPVLTVFDADGVVAAEADPDEPAPQALQPPVVREDRGLPTTLLVGGLLVIVAVLVVFAFRRGQSAAAPDIIQGPSSPPEKRKDDVDFATSALWPDAGEEFDGRTLRFIRPDPTVRLMPAKLEVIGGGDTGEEIRFVAVAGEDLSMMFGRAPGEGPTTVRLKQKTVSRTHAVIRHRHGEWLIENLSLTNPTVLNGETLGVKERLLTEGDRIEMGEVVFRFRE